MRLLHNTLLFIFIVNRSHRGEGLYDEFGVCTPHPARPDVRARRLAWTGERFEAANGSSSMAAWRVALLAAALLLAGARAQQNGSYTTGGAVTVSSNEAGPLGNIIDGLDNTQWQSGARARGARRPRGRRRVPAARAHSSAGTFSRAGRRAHARGQARRPGRGPRATQGPAR